MTSAKIIDGSFLSERISDDLKQKIAGFQRPPAFVAIQVGCNTASEVYIRHKLNKAQKIGIKGRQVKCPEKMPDCNTVFLGARPSVEDWQLGDKQFPTVIIDTAVTHPLMDSVQMGSVTIVEGTPLTGPKGTISLMDSIYGSVMAIAPRSGFEDLVMGFNLIEEDENGDTVINSDWPNKLSFPLFIQNSISWLGGASKFASSSGSTPGDLIRFRSRIPSKTVSVSPPSGSTAKLRPRTHNTYVYAGANQTGIYRVENDSTESLDQLLVVNLLDERESNLAVLPELEIGYDAIEGLSEEIPERQEYWTWVIVFALCVLLFEWYIYNRRVFI